MAECIETIDRTVFLKDLLVVICLSYLSIGGKISWVSGAQYEQLVNISFASLILEPNAIRVRRNTSCDCPNYTGGVPTGSWKKENHRHS